MRLGCTKSKSKLYYVYRQKSIDTKKRVMKMCTYHKFQEFNLPQSGIALQDIERKRLYQYEKSKQVELVSVEEMFADMRVNGSTDSESYWRRIQDCTGTDDKLNRLSQNIVFLLFCNVQECSDSIVKLVL